jgi:dienelactone hydrolase
MRSRFWCSALVAVALAGCGSSSESAEPYSYAVDTPLRTHVGEPLNRAGQGVRIYDFSFRGANGAKVEAFLLRPEVSGRRPAAVFLHGSGGSRADMLVPAALLAKRGAVTLTISMPSESPTYRPLVVDARRALDALASLPYVDRERLGVVGYSLGAQTAAIVAGVDRRPKAVAMLAGRGTERARQLVARAKAKLLFVGATNDERVPEREVVALARAAPGKHEVRWFPSTHRLTVPAFDAAVVWEAGQLGLRRR